MLSSSQADGLAVLRSSVREYLGAEAMAALGLPTSRALALIGIDSVKVRRETIETAAIVARVGQSWIRIGVCTRSYHCTSSHHTILTLLCTCAEL